MPDTVKIYWKGENTEFPLSQDNDIDLSGLAETPTVNPGDNDFRLLLSGDDFIKLSSCINAGAEIIYPNERDRLFDLFQCGLLCPPPFPNEEDECYSYKPYAPSVTFYPTNPYTQPNVVPPGYGIPPMYVYDGGITLLPGLEVGDVIVPFLGLTDALSVFLGQMTGFKITTYGSGQIEVDLISAPLGGKCLIGINKQPNLVDILLGIFNTSADTIVDLDFDALEFPPDDGVIQKQEIDINVAPGTKTEVYFSFMPVGDPLNIPVKYGGGFRSLQLCGFEDEGTVVGITQLRMFNGNVEGLIDGNWVIQFANIDDCAAVEACLPTSQTILDIQSDITDLENADTAFSAQLDQVTATNLQQTIDINTINAGQTQQDIKILALENRLDDIDSSPGQSIGEIVENEYYSWELLATVAAVGGEKTLDIDLSSYDFTDLRIVSKGAVQQGGGERDIKLYVNQDYNDANYDSSRDDPVFSGEGNFTRMASSNGATNNDYGMSIFHIMDANNAAESKTGVSFGSSQSGDSDSNNNDIYGWRYNVVGAITDLRFDADTGNTFEVGTEFRIYGGKVRKFAEIKLGFNKLFDFSVDDYSEVILQFVGLYQNNAYESQSGLATQVEVNLDVLGFNPQIDEVEMFYQITGTPDATDQIELEYISGVKYVDTDPIVGVITNKLWTNSGSPDNKIRCYVTAKEPPDVVAGVTCRITAIRVKGVGALPATWDAVPDA